MTDGWHHDPVSLLPVLDDEVAFRATNADDPALEALVALFGRRPAEAEAQLRLLLTRTPGDRRLAALLADARRDQGQFDESEETYRDLIESEPDPLRRVTFVQHLGKTLYAAGRFVEAEVCFAEALGVRIELGAAADQIASSELALAAARARATATR